MNALGYVQPFSKSNPFKNEYAVEIFTPDATPGPTSVWTALLLNWNTGLWDQVFQITGVSGFLLNGAAAWVQIPFKAGVCPPLPEFTGNKSAPSGLQLFSADIHL